MIYVWSDTHFNHQGILRYCAFTRPQPDVFAMNENLIGNWNRVVRKQDTIYLLGDFGFASRDTSLQSIFERLNGRKHLVRGNHDEQNPGVLKLTWESVHDLVTLREEGVRAVACHYPMETWKGAHRGYLMLHGHSHGTLKRKVPHRFDVGVDVRKGPVGLQQLSIEASQQESYNPTDHHGDL